MYIDVSYNFVRVQTKVSSSCPSEDKLFFLLGKWLQILTMSSLGGIMV